MQPERGRFHNLIHILWTSWLVIRSTATDWHCLRSFDRPFHNRTDLAIPLRQQLIAWPNDEATRPFILKTLIKSQHFENEPSLRPKWVWQRSGQMHWKSRERWRLHKRQSRLYRYSINKNSRSVTLREWKRFNVNQFDFQNNVKHRMFIACLLCLLFNKNIRLSRWLSILSIWNPEPEFG